MASDIQSSAMRCPIDPKCQTTHDDNTLCSELARNLS
jgi:hypothetical protein